uniref:S phase cyclin A-associated protein in the endoplasmic reticulum N-terminal domain-containing protein n=1 Tax=Romanomermis culicivorax TaxID=13658 RepID=A0A915J9R0_ROMCU
MERILKSGDYRALHWTHLFETLRRTVDAIYEICRADKSVIECKEAILILENYTRDFVGLIEFLVAVDAWERAEKTSLCTLTRKYKIALRAMNDYEVVNVANYVLIRCFLFRPTSIAWEIRKSLGSPKMQVADFQSSLNTTKDNVKNLLKESYDTHNSKCENCDLKVEAVQLNSGILQVCIDDGLVECWDTNLASPSSIKQNEGDWHIVSYAKNKLKSTKKLVDNQSIQSEVSTKSPINEIPLKTQSHKTIFPKNAQQIRQTKASLAKMEHNRQYLAEQRRKEVDHLSKTIKCRLPLVSISCSATSMPCLNYGSPFSSPGYQQRLGLNFADPDAVKRIAQSAKLKNLRFSGSKSSRKSRFRSYQSVESLCSLESIKEAEDEANGAALCSTSPRKTEISENSGVNETKTSISMQTDDDDTQDCREMSKDTNNSRDDETTTKAICDEKANTIQHTCNNEADHFDDEDKQTWQHLTEEEESLAHEEEILQREIEEERKSIDLEVNRRTSEGNVFDDKDDSFALVDEEKNKTRGCDKIDSNDLSISNVPVESEPMTVQELISRWKANVCVDDILQSGLS